jgi:hypothetical protein
MNGEQESIWKEEVVALSEVQIYWLEPGDWGMLQKTCEIVHNLAMILTRYLRETSRMSSYYK